MVDNVEVGRLAHKRDGSLWGSGLWYGMWARRVHTYLALLKRASLILASNFQCPDPPACGARESTAQSYLGSLAIGREAWKYGNGSIRVRDDIHSGPPRGGISVRLQ